MSIIKTVEGVAYTLISVPAEPGRGRHEIDHLTVGRLSARAVHSDTYTADWRLQELKPDPEQPGLLKNPSPKGLLDSFPVAAPLRVPGSWGRFPTWRNPMGGRRRWRFSGAGSGHGHPNAYSLRAIHLFVGAARLYASHIQRFLSCRGPPRHSVGQGLATSPGGGVRC